MQIYSILLHKYMHIANASRQSHLGMLPEGTQKPAS